MYSVWHCHDVAKHTEFYSEYFQFNVTSTGNAGCFRTTFTTLKACIIYSDDMYSVWNCHNVAKHTEVYLR
jgi:hypothetical protein